MSGPKLGQIIGVYQLEVELARGGMGTVYLADQTEPVTRVVALKVISRTRLVIPAKYAA